MKTTLFARVTFTSTFLFVAGVMPGQAQPGALDTNFHAASIVGEVSYSVAVQPDGKVIAMGTFGVTRFFPNGAVDPTFQPVALGREPWGGGGVGTRAVALQTDGRILLTGTFTNAAGDSLPTLLRLETDGSIDDSFNLAPNVFPNGHTLALQPDGKVLTGGFVAGEDVEHSGILRLLPDGSVDPDFNLDGFGGSTDFYSLALARDGKIYLGMFSELVRLNPDGTWDESFTAASGLGPFGAIAVQADGKVLVGQYGDGPGFQSVRRLLNNGADDPDWTAPSIDGGDHVIYAILLQPDGKVLVGGENLQAISGVRVASLGRLNADGSLDATFNTRGDLYHYSIEHLAFAADGKVFASGHNSIWPDLSPAPGVWRLHNNPELQPRLSIGFTAVEGIRLNLSGHSGATYQLEYREQVAAGPWKTLTTLTLAGPTGTAQDAGWAGSPARFYRAVYRP